MPRVMPPFVPSAEQRHTVSVLAGMLSWDMIRLVIVNKRTGKPISKETLQRHFVDELEVGTAKLKAKIVKGLYDQLDAGNWLAIQWGLRNVLGFRDTAAVQVGVNAEGDDRPAAVVTFHVPTDVVGHPLSNGHNGHASYGANGHD